jgi:succinyl-CoA:acetate CoA-transferase
LDDIERADTIIRNCASPRYRDMLLAYFSKAKKNTGGHHPILLDEAFSWHRRLMETGSMQEF